MEHKTIKYTSKISTFIKEALFPSKCAGCKKLLIESEVCEQCWKSLPINNSFFCAACGQRAPEFKNCQNCRWKTALASIGFAAPYSHKTIKTLTHWLKYDFISKAANPVGKIICLYLEKSLLFNNFEPKEMIIIPIPLHAKRLNWRGFNQSELICKIIAEKYSIPIFNNILTRVKNNKPQVEMPDFERREKNIDGIFAINPKIYLSPQIKKANVLLIDDVITSGATIKQAGSVLKQAGFKKIYGLAAAKG